MDERREKKIGDESCPDAFPVATVAANRVDDLGVLVNTV